MLFNFLAPLNYSTCCTCVTNCSQTQQFKTMTVLFIPSFSNLNEPCTTQYHPGCSTPHPPTHSLAVLLPACETPTWSPRSLDFLTVSTARAQSKQRARSRRHASSLMARPQESHSITSLGITKSFPGQRGDDLDSSFYQEWKGLIEPWERGDA